MKEAWGDVPIRTIPTDLGHGRELVFLGAATSDGKWLVGSSLSKVFLSPQWSFGDKVTWGPGDAVLVNVADGRVHTMARLTSPLSQIAAAASDGPWVVWVEADDNPYFLDWRLRAYDRRTGKTRELARNQRDGNALLLGPRPVPRMSGDRVVWGQAVGPLADPDPDRNAVVRMADLGTGEITTLVDHAFQPAISWPWVGWGTRASGYPQTVFRNLETGEVRRIDTGYSNLILDGATAAYDAMQGQVLCIVDDVAAGAPRTLASEPYSSWEWQSINDRVVGFLGPTHDVEGVEMPTQVYDRQLDALIDLPGIGYSRTRVAGPLLTWMSRARKGDLFPDLVKVLDTRDIPR
ncbi:MAG: hypothetical protein U0869_10285 [Chloroflexota bacterium]